MNHPKDMTRCSAGSPTRSNGRYNMCTDPAAGGHQMVPLCKAHRMIVEADMIEGFEKRMTHAAKSTEKAYQRGYDAAIATNWRASKEEKARRERDTVVYFLRCGEFVKIGTTINLQHRVASIRKAGGVLMPAGLDYTQAELVGSIYGGSTEERALHAQFAHLRHTGEWFTEAPELTAYIESRATQRAA